MRKAQQGLEELRKHVDTIIVVPNQNLFKIASEQTTFEESFALSNDVLLHGVQSITDLMVRPGLINLDFADVETVMSSMGKAMMGTGQAEGEGRAVKAAESAINNPLIAFPPAPPTPNTRIRGLSSFISGVLKFIVIFSPFSY